MRALRASTADVDDVARLVAARHRWFEPAGWGERGTRGTAGTPTSGPGAPEHDGWTDAEVRRIVHDVGGAFDDVVSLVAAAAAVEPVDPMLGRRVHAVAERVAHWPDGTELESFEPELDGAQVMEVLGIPPGRDVGRALAFLQEMRLDEGVVGVTVATERLRKWWTDHSK
jgi:hypothetical protein